MQPSPEIQNDLAALATGVGLCRLSRTLLEISGPDRAVFLHNLTTQNVKSLALHSGCELFIPNVQGRAWGHGALYAAAECFWFEGSAGQAPALVKHFDKYRVREQVLVADRSTDFAQVLLAGHDLEPWLESLTGVRLPAESCAQAEAVLGGRAVVLRRTPLVAGGILACLPAAQASGVIADLTLAGGREISSEAVNTLRVEAGFPEFGVDVTSEQLVQEVGRDRQAIHFQKGCYLGQETIARIDALGHVNRLLVGVRFQGDTVPAVGSELTAAGAVVGKVTSAVYSPRCHAPLALAYVKRGHNSAGTRLNGPTGEAEVVALPM